MKTIYVCLLLALSVQLSAQKSKVKEASKALGNYELAQAKAAIDAAVLHSKTSGDWKTWMLRGDVYAALSQEMRDQKAEEKYDGDVAFEAYIRALELSKLAQVETLFSKMSLLKKVMLNSGMTFLTEGQESRAKHCYELGVKIGEKIGEEAGVFHAMIAGFYLQDMMFLPAAESYMKAVEAGYETEQQMANALSALSLGGSPEYEEVLKAYRSEYPDNIDLKVNEVNHRLGQGDNDKAIVLLKELVEDDPSNINYRFNLGAVMLEQNDEGGLEHINMKLQQDPFHLPSLTQVTSYYFNRANGIQQQIGELDYESAAAKEKEKERNGILKEMLRYAERALRLDPDNMQLLSAMSTAYSLLDDEQNIKRINRKIQLLKEG